MPAKKLPKPNGFMLLLVDIKNYCDHRGNYSGLGDDRLKELADAVWNVGRSYCLAVEGRREWHFPGRKHSTLNCKSSVFCCSYIENSLLNRFLLS